MTFRDWVRTSKNLFLRQYTSQKPTICISYPVGYETNILDPHLPNYIKNLKTFWYDSTWNYLTLVSTKDIKNIVVVRRLVRTHTTIKSLNNTTDAILYATNF